MKNPKPVLQRLRGALYLMSISVLMLQAALGVYSESFCRVPNFSKYLKGMVPTAKRRLMWFMFGLIYSPLSISHSGSGGGAGVLVLGDGVVLEAQGERERGRGIGKERGRRKKNKSKQFRNDPLFGEVRGFWPWSLRPFFNELCCAQDFCYITSFNREERERKKEHLNAAVFHCTNKPSIFSEATKKKREREKRAGSTSNAALQDCRNILLITKRRCETTKHHHSKSCYVLVLIMGININLVNTISTTIQWDVACASLISD